MTESEAIKDIKENILPCVGGKSLEMAINELEEIQQYKEIGTVSEFAELKEKATAKSPAYQGEHEKCPTCGSFCIGEYCIKCGQRILCD